MIRFAIPFLGTFAALTLFPSIACGYSQLTHEELIDILWADSIRPLLLKRFPGTTEPALRRAHAFAYGGCLIQDIGYYPFGKRFFSDLAHYVRSGDFVAALLRNAQTADELAFAIGALSHYVGDSIGHSQATNPSTALTFPKLKAKYGAIVTYEDAPIPHGRTEFGFDVVQAARRRYAPGAYRRRMGFHVARQLLDRTFTEVYGIRPRGILGPARSALGSYRWSVTKLLPLFLGAQVVILGDQLPVEKSDAALAQFLDAISQAEYVRTGQIARSGPGAGAHIAAFFIIIIPKIGPLRALATKSPSTETEDLFVHSADHAIGSLRDSVARLSNGSPSELQLANLDLDTGKEVKAGDSELVDKTYAKLLLQITREHAAISPELRNHLLWFWSDLTRGTFAQQPKQHQLLVQSIEALRALRN